MDFQILGLSISASALLSASAAFLLGYYLKYWSAGRMDQASPFRILVVVLSIPNILISYLAISSIDFTNLNSDQFLLLVIVSSLFVPPLAYFGVLIFKR